LFAKQTNFDWYDHSLGMYSPEVIAALKKLSTEGEKEARGAIFTRSEVVNFILSRSRKGEVWMTKNGFGQLEQVFDRVSHHARQTA